MHTDQQKYSWSRCALLRIHQKSNITLLYLPECFPFWVDPTETNLAQLSEGVLHYQQLSSQYKQQSEDR